MSDLPAKSPLANREALEQVLAQQQTQRRIQAEALKLVIPDLELQSALVTEMLAQLALIRHAAAGIREELDSRLRQQPDGPGRKIDQCAVQAASAVESFCLSYGKKLQMENNRLRRDLELAQKFIDESESPIVRL